MKANRKSASGLRWRDLPGIVLVIVFLSLSLVALASRRPARLGEPGASSRIPEIPFARRGALSLVGSFGETTFGAPVR